MGNSVVSSRHLSSFLRLLVCITAFCLFGACSYKLPSFGGDDKKAEETEEVSKIAPATCPPATLLDDSRTWTFTTGTKGAEATATISLQSPQLQCRYNESTLEIDVTNIALIEHSYSNDRRDLSSEQRNSNSQNRSRLLPLLNGKPLPLFVAIISVDGEGVIKRVDRTITVPEGDELATLLQKKQTPLTDKTLLTITTPEIVRNPRLVRIFVGFNLPDDQLTKNRAALEKSLIQP